MTEPSLGQLQAELAKKKAELADREASLPAHSLRPHQIQELEELEDQVKELAGRIQKLESESA